MYSLCVPLRDPSIDTSCVSAKLHAWEVRVVKRSGKSDVETTEQVR